MGGSTFPVPECLEDKTGTCTKDGTCTVPGRTCCSRMAHYTEKCSSGKPLGKDDRRCGCVAGGSCAIYKGDCCSRKGHKTLACSAGVGYRCDGDAATNLTIAI